MLIPGRHPRADDGFTLVEVIITISIMGVVATGLFGIIISYLRTTTDAQSRMTESLDLQFLTAYWQRDVASIGVRSATYDPAPDVHSFDYEKSVSSPATSPARCAGPGTALITLAWSEYSSTDSQAAPDKVKVTYATRDGANNRLELLRIRCETKPSTTVVATNLSKAPLPAVDCFRGGMAISCDNADADPTGSVKLPTKITLTFTVSDAAGHGKTDLPAKIIGERRQT